MYQTMMQTKNIKLNTMRCLKNLLNITFVLFAITLHAQWQPLATNMLPDSQRVSSISVNDEFTVWAVAYYDKTPAPVPADVIPYVLLTKNGGLTWMSNEIDEAQGKITQDIFSVDGNTAWITTNGLSQGTQTLYKTTDGGNTWTAKLEDTSAGGLVYFFDANNGIVIHGKFMSTTNDGGETWNPLPIIDLPFEGNEDIFYRAGNNALAKHGDNLWFGTTFGRIFKSTNRGQTWEVFDTPLDDNDVIVSTAFRNELEGILISYSKLEGDSIVFGEDTKISLTFDGGETWEMTNTIYDFKINCMTVVPEEKITFMGATNGLSSLSSDTTGTWEHFSFRPYNAIEFFNAQLGWVGSGETSVSHPSAMYKWDGIVSNVNNLLEETIGVNVSPNPFADEFQLELNTNDFQKYQNENLELVIVDLLGKTIFSEVIKNDKTNIQFDAPQGAYLYFVKSNLGILNSGKIIKQ